jgi:hypothetical protein
MTVSRFFGGSVRTAPKVALSLLLSILLFAGLVVAAYAGLFNVLETRFYQPSVVKTMEKQLTSVADTLASWHETNAKRFQAFVSDEAVKRSLLPNQSADDITKRANLAGAMLAEMPGVIGIRIIDSGDTAPAGEADSGRRRIHFSTFKEDVLKKEDFRIVYEYYGAVPGDIPASDLTIPPGASSRVVTDAANDRFLYCFPFYDAYSTLRGTAVFYVSARAAVQNLVALNLIRLSDRLTLVSSADRATVGAVSGMPHVGESLLTGAILDHWGRRDLSAGRIVESDKTGWVLLSRDAGPYGFVGQLVEESAFTFSRSVRILFLSIGFLTLFLVIFLLFNLRQDSMVVIRSRIKKFQVRLLEELLEKSDDAQWEEIGKNLTYRKHDISAEIKKGFGRRITKKHGKEIDALLDKSWEEILAAIGRQEKKRSSIASADDIRLMLEQVLQNNAISLNLTGVPVAQGKPGAQGKPAAAESAGAGVSPKTAKAASTPSVRASAELEEIESLEEIPEAEPAEAIEELDEIEEAESVEEIEPLEEIEEAEAVEEAEPVEEIEEAEAVEEIEPLEEIEEAETATARAQKQDAHAHEIISADIPLARDGETAEPIEELEELEELAEIEGETKQTVTEVTPRAKPAPSPEAGTIAEEIAALAETVGPTEESAFIASDEKGFYSIDMEADLGTSGISLEEAEPAEGEPAAEDVDYLDGEWEPALLDVATEEELTQFIEETIPDHVLVYNFEEKPGLGNGPKNDEGNQAGEEPPILVENLDFTSLDAIDTDGDATEVDYIDSFILGARGSTACAFAEEPAIDLLEVIGDEEPLDLLELVELPEPGDLGSIVSEDGLFVIAPKPERATVPSIDPEFQELVDSVLQ